MKQIQVQPEYVVGVSVSFVLPCVAITLFSWNSTHDPWSLAALAIMTMCGAFVSGGLLGFLFALPRSPTKNPNSTTVRPNTNLEDVSDWLTKIVVGITLVELSNIAPAANHLFQQVGGGLGGGAAATGFAAGLIIYCVATGLMESWLATRLYITSWITTADDDALHERQEHTAKIRASQASPIIPATT